MHDSETRTATLRLALKVNGGFSGLSGVVLVLAAGPLVPVLGVGRWILFGIGVGLVLFAASLWRIASRSQVDPAEVRMVVWADVGWVVGSVVVVVAGVLSRAGLWLVGVIAVIVLGFAVWQHLGLRRLNGRTRSTRSAG